MLLFSRIIRTQVLTLALDSEKREIIRHFVWADCIASVWYNAPTSVEPMDEPTGDITRLLRQWREGSREAENQLFERVLPQLVRFAHYLMHRERKGHTMEATELVNEIYFRMVAAKDRDWRNRKHFFAIAARAMRRYLIDHFKGRPAAEFVRLDDFEKLIRADSRKIDLALTIDRLLDELAEVNPEWSMVVELKFFLGMTDEEAADAMGLSLRTMQRTWSDARKWLYERMDGDGYAQSAG